MSLFAKLPEPEIDAVLVLAQAFRADVRTDKVDLGIGVYRDENGNTPVMRAIAKATQDLAANEATKAYIGLGGSDAFNTAILNLLLGSTHDTARIHAVQTAAGAGALRLLTEVVKAAKPDATMWISDPSWFNHAPIAESVGLAWTSYTYLDAETQSVNFAQMCADLETASESDIVLLHACCHNPTGANLTPAQWNEVTALIKRKRLIPMLDIAYLGFADGLEKDGYALRKMTSDLPEVMAALSCSKTFGVYRDRVGAAIIVGETAAAANTARESVMAAGRVNYSFPPNFTAEVITNVLTDVGLRAEFEAELEHMRTRLIANREGFADAARKHLGDERFDYVAAHQGMFSRLKLNPDTIQVLRDDHGIFMPSDGRINVAGLSPKISHRVAIAIKAVS
ncbi:MAG: aromatic amino acid transaminase [Aestuariivita sp.]|nr:aromatic amino acid transaminase [Aestuariivita sp.]MCY4203435.1 aromatic amino acid transaminase [Aestuariivita sp.]